MPAKMAPHQLEFFRELLAPFDPSELSEMPAPGGQRTLTYIDKRALENRLDSVCSPHRWYCDYKETREGFMCKLTIACPAETPGEWDFVTKSDGAGREEMGVTNRQTGEFEITVNDKQKSAFTNAFRRAAQDAWGIGRYLYEKGIPSFLDPNATSAPPPVAFQAPAAASAAQSALEADRTRSQPPAAPQKPQPAPPSPIGPFRLPKHGRQAFPWMKEMEAAFETRLFDYMEREGENRGYGKKFSDWTEQQTKDVALSVVAFLREFPTYQGQYEYLFPEGGARQDPPA
jgi:hypothetical protein